MATFGTYGVATATDRALGAGSGGNHGGFQFTAPATGTISQIKVDTGPSGLASGTWTAQLYTDSAGSPGVTVGSASNGLAVTTSGPQIFTFPTPASMTNAVLYWMVLVNPGSNTWAVDTCVTQVGFGSGRNDTITSITNNLPSSEDWRMEITYAPLAMTAFNMPMLGM